MIGEVESVDEVEIIRRMTEGIYDKAEYKKALAWVKEKCRPDFDKNPVEMQKTPAQKEKDWEFTAKMVCVIKAATRNFPRAEKRKWSVITLLPGTKTMDGFIHLINSGACCVDACGEVKDEKGKSAFKSAYDVMNNWGANHGAISYGHIGADLITMCSMLRIPVCMHNVCENDIYRPASWNAFGMDKEGRDYRACEAYGPMYKNIRK